MDERIELRQLVTLQRGQSYKSAQLGEPGPVLLGLGTINRNGGFRGEKLKTYGGPSPEKALLRPGDLYVSLKDVTHAADLLGSVARVPDSVVLGRLTQDTIRLDVNEDCVDRDYLYWSLRDPAYRAYCRLRGTGTTNLDLSREDFLAYKLILPKRSTQRAIVKTLGALDDKIAANAKLAETARSIARVHFDLIMKSAVQESTLGDVLSLEYGKPLLAGSRNHGAVDVFGSGGIVGTHDVLHSSGPGVVVGRKGTAGAVHWASRDFFPIDTTFFVKSRQAEVHSMVFCFHLLQSLGLVNQNSDSAVPGLNRNDAYAIRVQLPADDQVLDYTEFAMPLMLLASQLDVESAALATTRDALLPELMSGNLRVKDAEKVLEGVL